MYRKTTEKEVRKLYKEGGKSIDAVVKSLGVSQATVYRYLKIKKKVKHGRKGSKTSGKTRIFRTRKQADESIQNLE